MIALTKEKMAQAAGFEPATNRLTAGCSTTELRLNSQGAIEQISPLFVKVWKFLQVLFEEYQVHGSCHQK